MIKLVFGVDTYLKRSFKMTVRKTISMDEKLEKKIFSMESELMKSTKHHWSESKLMSALMDYAINHGATAITIARIYDKK